MAPHLAAGTLVEILPDLRPAPLNAFFVVAHRRSLSQRVRAFMHWTEALLKPYFD
ncbi:transcriptional regulator [Pantoea septica]|uniref:Transcriptional regulator n=1 Tax=Pantoea septica TaxID=472695 RepID=A0ABX3UQS4_9GAMM|nr:transcriptional regulator [Pantoea septica]